MDVAACIASFNAGRDPQRLAIKYAKMRASAFGFLRGSCHLFYQRLPRQGSFETAPLAWCCGDLHLENFGSYKGDNRLSYFDINDFDEACLAPLSWDVVRFLTSLVLAAPEWGLARDKDVGSLCLGYLDAYMEALMQGKAYWVERDLAEGMVGKLLEEVRTRTRTAFLDARTVRQGQRRLIRYDNGKALPATPAQRERVAAFMSGLAQNAVAPGFFEVVDIARRIAGTGSLGVERYIVLIEGKGGPEGNYLLDLKQALPSCVAAQVRSAQPVWHDEASRVVGLQKRMQAVSMALLQAVRLEAHSCILRELQASEDRVALNQWKKHLPRLEAVMRTMGQISAWAHLRGSGHRGAATCDELAEFAAGRGWRQEMLAAAFALAEQTRADWRDYVEACAAGVFAGSA